MTVGLWFLFSFEYLGPLSGKQYLVYGLRLGSLISLEHKIHTPKSYGPGGNGCEPGGCTTQPISPAMERYHDTAAIILPSLDWYDYRF